MRSLFFVGVLALYPALAMAAIGGISNAQVTKGALNAQMRNAYSTDNDEHGHDDRWRTRLALDYGFTDSYAAGFFVQGDRRDHDNLELEAVMFDQRLEIHDAAKDGFYSGARLRYTWRDGDKAPDDIHLRLIVGAPIGRWEARFNQLLAHEIGEDSKDGLIVESRAQVTYGLTDDHRIGIESFNNFGNVNDAAGFDTQGHEVGPMFQGRLDGGTTYDVAYRRGISEHAADHIFRFVVGQAF